MRHVAPRDAARERGVWGRMRFCSWLMLSAMLSALENGQTIGIVTTERTERSERGIGLDFRVAHASRLHEIRARLRRGDGVAVSAKEIAGAKMDVAIVEDLATSLDKTREEIEEALAAAVSAGTIERRDYVAETLDDIGRLDGGLYVVRATAGSGKSVVTVANQPLDIEEGESMHLFTNTHLKPAPAVERSWPSTWNPIRAMKVARNNRNKRRGR